MLKIKHIMKFFGCSQRTAYRKMQEYKDALQTNHVTIKDFLEYEGISESAFYYGMQFCLNL